VSARTLPATRPLNKERKWVGKSIRRIEDPKFLRGRGNYIDDLRVDGMLHAALVRSPYPHATIKNIDAEEARSVPGVVAVVTGAEALELADPLPDFGPAPEKHTWRCLAAEKVRYVGEGVAAVVATSRYVAEDAADLVTVEYEQLPPVVDPEQALEPGAPLIHEPLQSNVAYERVFTFGDVDRDFAEADVVVADTGDDEDNLVVVLLSKKKSKARCIARVNNPANKTIFESLDPDDPVTVISSTELILDVLNEHVNASKYRSMLETMHLFGKGNMQLVKVAIPAQSPIADKTIAELNLPHNSVVVAIDRPDRDLEIPNGDTRLRAGDSMIVIVKNGAAERIRTLLTTP